MSIIANKEKINPCIVIIVTAEKDGLARIRFMGPVYGKTYIVKNDGLSMRSLSSWVSQKCIEHELIVLPTMYKTGWLARRPDYSNIREL